MKFNYHNRYFRAVANTENGETSAETIFHYRQEANRIWATYAGGNILQGHLLGKVTTDDQLTFVYHQLTQNMELQTGHCESVPEQLSSGKIRLHETWQWTSGDASSGESVIEEIGEDELKML